MNIIYNIYYLNSNMRNKNNINNIYEVKSYNILFEFFKCYLWNIKI